MNKMMIQTAKDAQGHADFKDALVSLLFQLADDNFIVGYRGSEWLGLAPHLEADVAFCSIAQDHTGHAALFYQLLEDLGQGKADDLAHLREAQAFKNAILVERPNGKGDYIVNPQYDWGYAVIRQYYFDLFEMVRLQALKQSSYEPLAQAAEKLSREKYYHVLHGQTWLKQMALTTDEAKQRLHKALQQVWQDLDELFDMGPLGEDLTKYGIIESRDLIRQRFISKAKEDLASVNMNWPGEPSRPKEKGREGEHTSDLDTALENISEVYRQDPAANW
ncbi:1,2-phenylacetyl-CoA epoxidase subunit PaaC [Caldalkalibacillus salinus]|uniref:1,2-phenylacetyl-CoA epoxidase subunit PaaC n=1 Tax=Caldalkalibacillus salinus TaxID=2803787 RepID=UPI001F00FA28|nr:1,2-phenylacetyl-CoA epoxidase subunit PaaC [Caldalkalibacillus salinus]